MSRLKLCLTLWVMLSTGAAGSMAFAQGTEGEVSSDSVELSPCHIPRHRQEAQCGTYTVFENRSTAEGRIIDIHFAIIPAVDETKEPDPLVFFAGGPGQAATDMAQFVNISFSTVNEQRDIVLIDQRGMGSSNPLKCDTLDDEEGLMWSPEERKIFTGEFLNECLSELDADVTLYTQDLANQDIHDVLLALGYDRVNLYGVSWGTRSALLYAHQYPEHVRTLVLDGSLPLQNAAPGHAAADAERALTELFNDCAADQACAEAFPDLRRDFDSVMERLGPDGESISFANPLTGEPLTMLLTRDMLGDILRTVLYSAELSRMAPLIIHQAASGDFRGVIGVSSALSGSMAESMSLGASLTIFCSEELARMNGDEPDGQRLLGRQMIENFRVACETWPTAPIPAIYGEDVGSSAPALLLSGYVDPITPPHWGERMMEALPNSMHLVAPATGHNVAPMGCASELIAQVIEQGDLEGLDGSCLEELTRPTFFVSSSGPKATPTSGSDGPAGDDEAAEEDAESGVEDGGAQ